MKKILVLSDSHNNNYYLNKILAIHALSSSLVIFLGDGFKGFLSEMQKYKEIPFEFLSGNNDYPPVYNDKTVPSYKIFEFESYKFFICHGHTFRVKEDLNRVVGAAYQNLADFVLWGHTHSPYISYVADDNYGSFSGALRLFCPGSIGRVLPGNYYSFGLIEINKNGILQTVARADNGDILL